MNKTSDIFIGMSFASCFFSVVFFLFGSGIKYGLLYSGVAISTALWANYFKVGTKPLPEGEG